MASSPQAFPPAWPLSVPRPLRRRVSLRLPQPTYPGRAVTEHTPAGGTSATRNTVILLYAEVLLETRLPCWRACYRRKYTELLHIPPPYLPCPCTTCLAASRQGNHVKADKTRPTALPSASTRYALGPAHGSHQSRGWVAFAEQNPGRHEM